MRRRVALPGLRVGRSRIHGRGVFARVAIARRRKLGELSGRLRPVAAARREHLARGVIMLVELSRRRGLDLTGGNDFRHLNHSCAPNCYLRQIGLRVEVYARGPIPAGAELTVDYGLTQHRGGMACGCGAPACRGRV